MVEKHSQAEKNYYQQVVEKAAEAGKLHAHDSARFSEVIHTIFHDHAIHNDFFRRFGRDVHRRIRVMMDEAQSDQESQILQEYQGRVELINKTYQPTGVSEDFEVTVRPDIEWTKIRTIWDKVFGRRIGRDEFHEIITQTESAHEELETARRNVALLQASRKSTKELLSLGASGLFYRFRKPKSGILSPFVESTKDVWNQWKQNRDAAAAIKSHEKIIQKKIKAFERQAKLRDAVLDKVDDLREQSRELYSQTFQREIDLLLDQQGEMSKSEFLQRKAALKEKVDDWCSKTGFFHMKVFFQEEFGEVATLHESVSPLETQRRKALLARFSKNALGSNLSEKDLLAFVDVLETFDPPVLELIYGQKYPAEALEVLRFLFQGSTRSATLLPKSRTMSENPEDLAHYASYALDYIQYSDCFQILEIFARDWPETYARDFDNIFDLIRDGVNPPSNKESINTDSSLPDAQEQHDEDASQETQKESSPQPVQQPLEPDTQKQQGSNDSKEAAHSSSEDKSTEEGLRAAQRKAKKANKKIKKLKKKLKKKKAKTKRERSHKEPRYGEHGSSNGGVHVNVIHNQQVKFADYATPSSPPPESNGVKSTPQPASPDKDNEPAQQEKKTPEVTFDDLTKDEKNLLHTFRLFDAPAMAREIYHDAFGQDEDWQHMFHRKKNREILRMFITGKLRKIQLTPPNLKDQARFDYIKDVLELLSFIDASPTSGLEHDYEVFIEEHSEHTCVAFLTYLKEKYKHFI